MLSKWLITFGAPNIKHLCLLSNPRQSLRLEKSIFNKYILRNLRFINTSAPDSISSAVWLRHITSLWAHATWFFSECFITCECSYFSKINFIPIFLIKIHKNNLVKNRSFLKGDKKSIINAIRHKKNFAPIHQLNEYPYFKHFSYL